MTEHKQSSPEDQSALEQRAAKKPYRKPEFRYEKVFETLALACGKTPGGGSPSPCHGSGRKS